MHLCFEKPGRLRGPSSHVAPYHALVSRRQTSVPGQSLIKRLNYRMQQEKGEKTKYRAFKTRIYKSVCSRHDKNGGRSKRDGVFVPQKNFFPLESTTIPYGAAQGVRERENSGWRRGVYGIKKKLLIMCARQIRSPHLVTD